MEETLFLLLSNLKYFLVAVCKNTIRSMNLLLSLTRVMGERAAVVRRAVEWFERGSGGSVYKAVNQKNKTLFSECDTVVMFLKYKNNPVGSWANLYEKCTLHPVRCVWPALFKQLRCSQGLGKYRTDTETYLLSLKFLLLYI